MILRTYKLNDADRIVVFLTRDRGKKRGVAKGARRLRSRFRGALEPLTRASVVYFEKESRELVSLNDADTEQSPLAAFHPEALGYVGYLAELIDEWAPENDPNEKLFRLGAAVVEALADGRPGRGPGPLLRVLAAAPPGRLPVGDHLPALQRIAGRRRPAVAGGPHPGVPALRPAGRGQPALAGGARRSSAPPATLGPLHLEDAPLSATAERELAVVHRALITWHLEKDLRSARVLREMRHDERH